MRRDRSSARCSRVLPFSLLAAAAFAVPAVPLWAACPPANPSPCNDYILLPFPVNICVPVPKPDGTVCETEAGTGICQTGTCVVSVVDTDGDGTPDSQDGCPADPGKTAPGSCGCGVSEPVSDGRQCTEDLCGGGHQAQAAGFSCNDYPGGPLPGLEGLCDGLGNCILPPPPDADGDGVPDSQDRCDGFPDHVDTDGDGAPDGCDPCPSSNPDDADGDAVCDSDDVCPGQDDLADADGDGVPDCLDGCPTDQNKTSPGACGCGTAEAVDDGDACTFDQCGGVHRPVNCDDGYSCTEDSCDPGSGQCLYQPFDIRCDNASPCDGAEVCAPGERGAGADGCVTGEPLQCEDGDLCNGIASCDVKTGCFIKEPPVVCEPPPGHAGSCNPSSGQCEFVLVDADGDGVGADQDCDDGNPAVFPGAAEACDGLDNDCDGTVDEGCTPSGSQPPGGGPAGQGPPGLLGQPGAGPGGSGPPGQTKKP